MASTDAPRSSSNGLTNTPQQLVRDQMYYGNPGAYTVRYLFVIYSFSFAETEDLQSDFSWVEPLNVRGPNLFDTAPKTDQKEARDFAFLRVTDRRLIPF